MQMSGLFYSACYELNQLVNRITYRQRDFIKIMKMATAMKLAVFSRFHQEKQLMLYVAWDLS